MEGFADKHFIPIVNFQAKAENDDKEAVSSIVENLLIRQNGIQDNVAIGLNTLLRKRLITLQSILRRTADMASILPKRCLLKDCVDSI